MVPVHFYLANKQLCWCYSVDCVLFLHSEASGGGLWVVILTIIITIMRNDLTINMQQSM